MDILLFLNMGWCQKSFFLIADEGVSKSLNKLLTKYSDAHTFLIL